jgi:hypothetical protein
VSSIGRIIALTPLTPLVLTISKGPDKGGYYHELFLRSKRFLTRRIVRCEKGIDPSKRKSSKPPDFHVFPFLPKSVPKNLPQAVVQSTGGRVQDRSFEESTDIQLLFQRKNSHGYIETEEHRPRIPSNVPVNTPTFARFLIRNQQPAPSISRFAASNQSPPCYLPTITLQLKLEELGRGSSASTQSPPCYIPTIPLQLTLEELGRRSSAMNSYAMSPLDFFRLQQLSIPK